MPTCVDDLPVEVLQRVFASVPFACRHNAVPLVCRAWRDAAAAADAWQTVVVDKCLEWAEAAVQCREPAAAFDLERFLTWFGPRAPRVHDLTLSMSAFSGAAGARQFHDVASLGAYEPFADTDGVLVPLLAALGPSLRRLTLSMPAEFDVWYCCHFLRHCPALESLSLSCQCAYDSQFEELSAVVSLTALSIEVTEPAKFARVPAALQHLTRLTHLALSVDNSDTCEDLPPWFGQLAGLRRLALVGYSFTAFPDVLTCLTALEALDFSWNYFGVAEDSYPAGLAALAPRLTSLTSQHSPLRAVPAALARLTSLRELDLAHNSVAVDAAGGGAVRAPLAVPAALTCLQALEALTLACNHLTREHMHVLARLTRLRRLDVSDCALTSLPGELSALTGLTRLDASWNDLRAFPASALCGMDALECLLLRGNPRMELEGAGSVFRTGRALRSLDLRWRGGDEAGDVDDWRVHDVAHALALQVRAALAGGRCSVLLGCGGSCTRVRVLGECGDVVYAGPWKLEALLRVVREQAQQAQHAQHAPPPQRQQQSAPAAAWQQPAEEWQQREGRPWEWREQQQEWQQDWRQQERQQLGWQGLAQHEWWEQGCRERRPAHGPAGAQQQASQGA